jgi:murein DD-endopeptidase MepM/ murein hydrolase activator NlpD
VALASLALAGACTLPRWPIEGPMTSPYGLRFRGMSPDIHPGVDIAAAEGTPVRAMKPGTVVFAGSMTGYGLTVILEHGSGLRTLYAHMSALEVEAGQALRGRDVIGRVGRTGNATAPHLHFEIRQRGHQVDPVPLLGRRPRPTR